MVQFVIGTFMWISLLIVFYIKLYCVYACLNSVFYQKTAYTM